MKAAIQSKTASHSADLVIVSHGQPVTTTVRVAAAAGLKHASVIKMVRERLADLEELGTLRFEIAKSGGRPTEYAILNEQHAALLFLYQRNTVKVSAFKLRMVKDFARVTAELSKLKAMQSAPEWKPARIDTKRAFRLMTDVIKETRDDVGKPATKNTYMHESWAVNYAMTGLHQASIDRDALPPEELRLLELIEIKNSVLFVRGLSRKDRRNILRGVVLQARADRVVRIGAPT